jgi:hypothetical protein
VQKKSIKNQYRNALPAPKREKAEKISVFIFTNYICQRWSDANKLINLDANALV